MPGMSGQQGIAEITARGGGIWKPPKPAAPAPAPAPAPVAPAAPAASPPPAFQAYGGPQVGAIQTWGGPAAAAAAAAPAPQQQRWGGWGGNRPFDWGGGPGGAGWTPPPVTTDSTGATTTAPTTDQTARLAAMTQRYAQMNPNSSLIGGAGWNPSIGNATRQQMRGSMWGGGMAGGNRWMTGLGGLLGG